MIINQNGGGKSLPELTNPATAAEIVSGYEAIDGEGNLILGAMAEVKETNVYHGETSIPYSGSSKTFAVDNTKEYWFLISSITKIQYIGGHIVSGVIVDTFQNDSALSVSISSGYLNVKSSQIKGSGYVLYTEK